MENEAPNLLAWSLISSPSRDFTRSLNSQITDLLLALGFGFVSFFLSSLFFFSKRYLFSGRTPGVVFHVQPGGRGASGWWRGRSGREGETGEEETGTGAVLTLAPSPPSCPRSCPSDPTTPVHPRPTEKSSLSSRPPLRLLLAHVPEKQPRNYTPHLYNKCSHIHDLISASSGPGKGQVGLAILAAQAGKLRLRKGKQFAPGCASGGGKVRTEAWPQIRAH